MVPFQALKLCGQYACCVILSWQLCIRYVYWRNSESSIQIHSVPPDVEESLAHDQSIPHDIFLSHSGFQKGFVKDLYEELRCSYSSFFDITYHSLPLAENFPKGILQAAKKCQLAVVVVSEEFVCSKWPMVELCAFVDADIKILPLFYNLLPADLKHQGNLRRWEKKWKNLDKKDGKHRINISKWANALTTLSSHNGVVFDRASEGEKSYLHRIMSGMHINLPPAFEFDTCQIRGKDHLCQVILDKFEEMEVTKGCALQPKVSVLGLYGLGGSGKSTLCMCLCDHFRQRYGPSRTLYLEMPSHPLPADMVCKFKELLHLTDFKERMKLHEVTKLEQVVHLLKANKLSSCRVFLVVDNISDQSWAPVQTILNLGVGQGSKLILVAHTRFVLDPILSSLERGGQCTCDSIPIPSINETEAIEILVQTAKANYMASDTYASYKSLTLQELQIVQAIVRKCSFHGDQRLPLVMKTIGSMLVTHEGDIKSWGRHLGSFWETVKTLKEGIVKKLVGESFKALPYEQLRLLFLDVALFISHLQSEEFLKVDEAIGFLCVMHGITSTRINIVIKDLQRHCFLTVSEKGIIGVHDVYLEFAKSIQNDTSKFMNSYKRWCWEEFKGPEAGVVVLKEGETKPEHSLRTARTRILQVAKDLRTLILQVGKGCESVDLQGLSCLKAVVLRNCMSLKVLGLVGLSSLVYLSFDDCASLRKIECNDMSLHNLKWLRIVQTEEEKSGVIAPKQSNALELGIASQMRNLQVVYLQNTGIKGLENMCSWWPKLQNLSVIERLP